MAKLNCKRCEFKNDGSQMVLGYGNRKSKVVVIGEAPGKLEIHHRLQNRPMIGETGAVLNWALRKANFCEYGERDNNLYITNALKCYPTSKNDIYNAEKVQTKHLKCCRKWLKIELKKIKPKYVLLTGKSAYGSFTQDYQASIEKKRGFWEWSEEFNCWFYATVHPANVVRTPGGTAAFYRDIETFTLGVKNGVKKPSLGKHYKTITKFKLALKYLKALRKVKRVAFDFETTSLKFWDSKEELLGMSFCWKTGHAVYIPWLKKGGEDYFWSVVQRVRLTKMLKYLMEDGNVIKDGQNMKFDINWLRHYEIGIKGVDRDTMIFHHLLEENTPANLTYLTSYYRLNFPRYEDAIAPYKKKVGNKGITYIHVPTKFLGTYACADVDAVWRIRQEQDKIAVEREHTLYRTMGQNIWKFCGDIEWAGVRIDVDRIDEMSKQYQKRIEVENKALAKKLKRDTFNVASPPQMQEALFGKEEGSLRLKGVFKTPGGKWSTNKDTFIFLRRNYERRKKVIKVLDAIASIRTMRKMSSTYLIGFKKLVDDENRVHTSYLPTGTVTGRPASMDPNVQNVPRDPIFRSLFVAPPGYKLIVADYSQIEARLIAYKAREIKLILKFENPEFDVHTYNSAIVRGISESEITKEQRSHDKAVTFGINYDRSAKSIAEEYNMDLGFVQDFIYQYFQKYSKIKAWRDRSIRLSKKNGYLQLPTGRRRRFMAYEWLFSDEMEEVTDMRERVNASNWLLGATIGGMERQAINFPIQGYAAELLSKATHKINCRLKAEELDANLVLTVHDMIAVQALDKHVKKAKLIVDEEMPFTLRSVNKKTGKRLEMNFPIDCEVSQFWKQ